MKELQNELTSEEQKLKAEKAEYEAYWLSVYSETTIAPENLRECGPEIAEFEAMIASFESEHSLLELLSIIDLTLAEAQSHPIREPARLALKLIIAKRNSLKDETNISAAEYERLNAEYKRLSRAVGVLNDNKVDHNR
ncbi:MAG: hypothetical protein UT32_C0006G0036 [Parcubacteria group bacterium GW2011_GWC2_39_14]|nr:MAG: hypothetical protein UT32_C0006G0036 [Parcubacteria group bacterium GW2011_GWC2_39_14]KKR54824.1 MAG: hypothetical protein UT91_C0009G0036 [Parcubacteria group bacterium GW2011_GWA2_40_23]